MHVNEVQGNPFQTDINYRGYTASPLLGTPQGLSVYMDGVRLNQPFGEVMSWDLFPVISIASTTLMPGSNPLFGLNTLGGALSIQTKDGQTTQGTTVQAIYGSDERLAVEFEHGGRSAAGLHWYLAGNLFAEDGWRDDSPSDVRQVFGKLGWQRAKHDVSLTAAYANNSLTGNGLQEAGSSSATTPASTRSRTPPTIARRSSISRRGTASSPRGVLGQRVLPRHPHEHAQRRHQRGLAGPGDLPAECRRAGGARGCRIHRCPGQRGGRHEHAVSLLALHRQRPAQRRAGREVQRTDQPDADRAAERRGLRAGHAARHGRPQQQPVHGRRRLRLEPRRASGSPPSSAISIPIAA